MRNILLLTILLGSISAVAQKDSLKKRESFKRLIINDVTHAGKAILFVYKRPFTWKKKEWATFGGVAAAAVGASFLDEPINEFFEKNQSKVLDPFADFGDFMGQPEYQGPFLLGFWGLGLATRNEWIRETSTMMAASMAASGLIQSFSKEAAGRARPSRGTGNTDFKPFGGKNYHSFPSGHTMLALSSAWIMARQVEPMALKVTFYAIPTIVGWSRLYDNAHWFSDILLGSALGIATAEAVIQYYKNIRKDSDSQAGLTILPNQNGLSLFYRF